MTKTKKYLIGISITAVLLIFGGLTNYAEENKRKVQETSIETIDNTNTNASVKETTVPAKKTKVLQNQDNVTDIDLVKRDFEACNDTAEVIINKANKTLTVTIYQDSHVAGLQLGAYSITQYTDWCLDNIKKDIEILDIAIIDPANKVHAELNFNKVDNDYFDENYVSECMSK